MFLTLRVSRSDVVSPPHVLADDISSFFRSTMAEFEAKWGEFPLLTSPSQTIRNHRRNSDREMAVFEISYDSTINELSKDV